MKTAKFQVYEKKFDQTLTWETLFMERKSKTSSCKCYDLQSEQYIQKQTPEVLGKERCFKNVANSQENTGSRDSFLIKLQGL